jgi:hypothetical protein
MCLVTTTIEGDRGFGSSVVLSDDGNTAAVMSAPGLGNVKVYSHSQETGEWTQIGNDILGVDEDGQPCPDEFYSYDCVSHPQSVSLSSDGTRIAIGYPGKSHALGKARVFERNSASWVQVGDDIVGGQGNSSAGSACYDDMIGQDCSWWYKDYMQGLGYSVSLSADGSRLAVGSIGSRYSTGSYYSGNNWNTDYATVRLVRVYQEPNGGIGQWSKLGNSLDAAGGVSISSDRYGRMYNTDYGASVSLSDDGLTLAMAGWRGYNTSIHRYHSDQNEWLQVGDNITFNGRWYNEYYGSGWIGDTIGQSIELSGDAKRVVISTDAKDMVGVYELNHDTEIWTIMGDFIQVGDTEDKLGHSVAISRDGTRIAIGAPYANSADPDQSHYGDKKGATRVYVWSLGSWKGAPGPMFGTGNYGYSGASVSLSADGTRLIVGERSTGSVIIRDLPLVMVATTDEDEDAKEDSIETGKPPPPSNPTAVPPSPSTSNTTSPPPPPNDTAVPPPPSTSNMTSPPPSTPSPPPPNRLIFGGDYDSSTSRCSVVTALVVSIIISQVQSISGTRE